MCRQDHQAHPEAFKLGKSDVNHDPASQIGKTVVNLSKIKLSKSEISLLEKGLNYIPTPKTLKNEPILDSARQFGRRLKLAYRFRNSKYNSKENFTAKSNWTPPDKEIPQLVLDTIKNIESDISNLKVPYHENNLSHSECKAIKDIRNNPDIIIKPADKGSATVIMNKSDYINEGYRQLNDVRYYKQIPNHIYLETAEKVTDILYDLCKKQVISHKQYMYLKPPEVPRPRQFYMLPKIHKKLESWPNVAMPPGRPIISDCSSESYKVSEYIDHFLQPLASLHESYIKDTYHFINTLKQVKVNESTLIVSLDVDSMYTNIDHESGLEAVKQAFKDNPNPIRPDQHILELLELSLKTNDFVFNGDIFLQLKGTAMGKKYAPSYANIFMAHFEKEAMKKSYLKPTFYRRFLDDIFLLWDHGRDNLDFFLQILNSHHPSIRLTANIQEKENEFLDVTIYKGPSLSENGHFDTKVYFKPTDTHQLLHKKSFHPRHTFRGIIKSQIIRFNKICSQRYDLDKTCSVLFRALKQRGYSARFLRSIKSQTLDEINSGKLLPPPETSDQTDMEFFSEACDGPRCLCCENIIECSTVYGNTNDVAFRLRHDLTCDSQNIIYVITCKECSIQYIGQTGQQLRDRTNNHRADIVNCRDTVIGIHFNSNPCMLEDFKITPIFQCPDYNNEEETTKKRLEIEQYFIDTFKTYHPYGLNIALKKHKDTPSIHYSVPYSNLGVASGKIVRTHYNELQKHLPQTYLGKFVCAYSRNKNLKDVLVSSKIR